MRHVGSTFFLLALTLLAAMPAGSQTQQAPPPPDNAAEQPSAIEPLASKSLLLDLAWAGKRAVAVGEYGNVLYSDDQGATWTQVQVPVSANLTAVYFVDAQHGWAVGHDEVVLRTDDGGLTWERTRFDPDAHRPLLDVWFGDPRHGLAIGAYGTVLSSSDGGRTWNTVDFQPKPLPGVRDDENPDGVDDAGLGYDFHLNAIVHGPGHTMYIGAEAGRLLRSDDDGATWRELPSPYDGSFYGVLPLEGDALLAYGLRGNVFRSDDGGQHWEHIATGTTALLDTAVHPEPNIVVIGGLTGVMLVSTDGGRTFAFTQQEDRKGIAALLWVGDGEVIAAGEGGVHRLAVAGLR